MLEGLLSIYPNLACLADFNVIVRADADLVRDHQVALISGGGSGHEPAHAGFVGAGMLSAAVAGEVFTSPPADAVLAAIKAAGGSQGVLLIVKNYTGDRLNFGLAAEMARGAGIPVAIVLVADDIALAATHERSGRRGIAGTILVHKIAGAAAAQGMTLDQVAALARAAAEDVATIGISLSAGTVPAVGKPSYTLGDSEIELGLGIHGEPGIRRGMLRNADEHADEMVDAIQSAHSLRSGEQVAILVNNLGATTAMELAIIARRAIRNLESRGIIVQRVYAGTFMSSLEAAGVSISVMKVNDERMKLLDAPTSAPAWPNVSAGSRRPVAERTIRIPAHITTSIIEHTAGRTRLHRAIEAACEAIIAAKDTLAEMDRVVGDGDLGINLARGAKAAKKMLGADAANNAADTLCAVAETLQHEVGGSSGPLYGVLLLRAANVLRRGDPKDPRLWARATREGCDAVSEIGGATAGDRTMLDALIPFANTLTTTLEAGDSVSKALSSAVLSAEQGARTTADMLPRRGRSSYLGEQCLGKPDPGATAVAIWLRALAKSLASE
jgi:dihydroxyacetone kinase